MSKPAEDPNVTGPAADAKAGGAKAGAEVSAQASVPAAPKSEVYGEPPSARAMVRFIKPALWGLLVVYVVTFLVLNRGTTRIDFVIFDAEVPNFVALFVMVFLGAVIGAAAMWWKHRRAV
jgi:uncharacterized integral membrane protein